MDDSRTHLQPEELLAHQIEQFRLLHAELAKANTKLIVIIIIMLVSVLVTVLPWVFMPMFNLVNVIK